MDFAYPFTAIGTLLIILMTQVFSFRVGQMRQKSGVSAPEISGDDAFNRAFRVHMNTIEQWVLFLPALWIFAMIAGDLYAGIGAVIWLVSRVIYSQAYLKDPKTRLIGFLTGFLTLMLMVFWSVGVLIWGLAT